MHAVRKKVKFLLFSVNEGSVYFSDVIRSFKLLLVLKKTDKK